MKGNKETEEFDLSWSEDAAFSDNPDYVDLPIADDDELLTCFLTLSKYLDRAISATHAGSGIPLEDGRFTPANIKTAAERAGLAAHVQKFKLDKNRSYKLPVILLMQGRGACILWELEKDAAIISAPGGNEEKVRVAISKLQSGYMGYAIDLKPLAQNITDTEINYETPAKGHWFRSVLWKLKPDFIQVGIASFLTNCLAIAAPLFMLNVYDRVLPNSAFSTLWILAVGMACVLVFELTFRVLRGLIIDRAGRIADVNLASRLFDHVLKIRMNDRPGSSGAFANKLREFETVREFFSSTTLIALIDLLFICVFLGVIYMVGGPLVIIPAIAVIFVTAIGLIIQPFMMGTVREVQEEASQKHSLLIEAITGIETIKAANAEGEVLKKWEQLVDRTASSTEKVRFFSINMLNLTVLAQQCVSVAIVIYGVYLFDEGLVSMGAIIATVILAGRAVAPLGTIAGTLSRAQQSMVALRNLDEVMQAPAENDNKSFSVAQPVNSGEIIFEDVNFSYPANERPALSGASFKIEHGDRVGIIGKVGAGKSTLIRIISGLFSPQSGVVKIDGKNVEQLHTADIRNAMGIVLQDATLIQGTIYQNITLGMHNVSEQSLKKACYQSGADSFIAEHPNGFGMIVGERGQNLSGGQRQFVTLSRALLRDPKIIIMDEPTSAMDSGSEQLFINRFSSACEDKTVIISTHRHSLLSLVDKLMLIDRGKVVAFGPKAEVLAMLTGKPAGGKNG